MKKIAIALILFQLIGCAKHPVVTTHPEKKPENETHKDDTPQTPKTNYLKIGAYIGGAVIAILAVSALILIAYCCSNPIAKQDKQDIDRIVKSSDQEIRRNYPHSEDNIRKSYPDKGGLEAILKWYLLQPVPRGTIGARPGETNLSYQREYTKTKLNEEVERERKANPQMPISELFTNIESRSGCFIETTKEDVRRAQQTLGGMTPKMWTQNIMNSVARIVYYYEFRDVYYHKFKNALIVEE